MIKVVAMGRRWGKTHMSGVLSAAVADHGGAVAWVVPTYANSRPSWRFVERLTAQSNQVKVLKADRRFEFPSGGWLGVYTADNDVSLRGEAFDLVIIDEAAQVRGETWTDVIMPTLADRDGRAILISTPKGRNWFWAEYQRGLADGKHQVSFTAPSAANPMPTIQRAAALAKDRVSERTYRQEWLAEFVEDGAYFTNVRGTVRPAPTLPRSGHGYVIGVDWARATGGDATVFCVLDATDRQVVQVVRMTGAPFDVQLTRLRETWLRWQKPSILAEYNSLGGPLVEQLQRAGLPVQGFTTTAASKHEIITGLQMAIERGELGLIDDPVLLAELEAYEIKQRAGVPWYGAPDGLHDDTVIALALAWREASAAASADLWLGALAPAEPGPAVNLRRQILKR